MWSDEQDPPPPKEHRDRQRDRECKSEVACRDRQENGSGGRVKAEANIRPTMGSRSCGPARLQLETGCVEGAGRSRRRLNGSPFKVEPRGCRTEGEIETTPTSVGVRERVRYPGGRDAARLLRSSLRSANRRTQGQAPGKPSERAAFLGGRVRGLTRPPALRQDVTMVRGAGRGCGRRVEAGRFRPAPRRARHPTRWRLVRAGGEGRQSPGRWPGKG